MHYSNHILIKVKNLKLKVKRVVERIQGVDFISYMDNNQTGVPNILGEHYSSSADFKELQKVIVDLSLDKNKGIFDFGCGKGAALLFFHKQGFKNIGGVELSEKLIAICENNLRVLKLNHIEVFQKNAAEFVDLDQYNYFYFYNPFPQVIMQQVIENIYRCLRNSPRQILLIYCNPTCHEIITRHPGFEFVKSFPAKISNRIINIYKSKAE